MKKRNLNRGFTLVELLAVIVILAIILVIAVPKVMSVIEDSKKATLESTAKMIASSAEKQKVQNTVLGNTDAITCDSVAKINKLDYASCSIDFDNNTAKVTIAGSGKFAGLYVCNGTKTEATASEEECANNNGVAFIQDLLAKEETLNNGLVQTNATYNGTTYDAGIRYVGAMADVKNKVYYNCEETDTSGVSYGAENYNYASSCEVWRIIGVFDTKTSEGGASSKRIKLINTNSTFTASWDSSASGSNEGETAVNEGLGINQWGSSTYSDGTTYEGADLMRLLNGFYIGEDTSCTYCFGYNQLTCSNECTTESLTSLHMKPLTNKAKSMIGNALWDTYAVKSPDDSDTTATWAEAAYLEEKGISAQNTGKSLCVANGGGDYCNDNVERITSWTGLVGLMSVSDITYANGWLYNQSGSSLYPWSISPGANSGDAVNVWTATGGNAYNYSANNPGGVFASVYLNSDIEIIGGDGDSEPYKLK